MNMILATPTTPSNKWMLALGVDAADVAFLDHMSDPVEMHMSGNRERVERIWTAAMERLRNSASPAAHLAKALI